MAFLQKRRQLRPAEHLETLLLTPSLGTAALTMTPTQGLDRDSNREGG